MKTTKKIIAIVLSVMLLLSVMPMAFAATTEVADEVALNEAIANAAQGDTIKLTDTIVLTDTLVIPSGKQVKLNLNGKDLYGAVNGKLISNAGTLNIYGTGHIYNTDISAQGHDAVYNTGTLEISGSATRIGDADNDMTNANAINRGAAVRNFGGTAKITGGYFTACDNFTNGGYAYALINDNGGTMNITPAGDSYVKVYGKNNGNIANNDGTVNIKAGTFTLTKGDKTNYYNLYVCEAAVTNVSGGTFTATNTTASVCVDTDDYSTAAINITGGTFNTDGTTVFKKSSATNDAVNVSGGTFLDDGVQVIPANVDIPEENIYTIPDGSGAQVAIGDDTVAVYQNTSGNWIASDSVMYALQCAKGTPTTVYVLKDVENDLHAGKTYQPWLRDGSQITLDLQGHNVTTNYGSETADKVTASIVLGSTAKAPQGCATLNIVSATPATLTAKYGISLSKNTTSNLGSTLNVGENVTLKSTDATYTAFVDASATNDTINVEGTIINENENGAALYVNGSAGTGNTINVEEGATVQGGEAGIYAAGNAVYNIDGTVAGDTGIYVAQGTVNVNEGAKVVGNGAKNDYEYMGSGFASTGDGIAVDSKYSAAPTVNVNEGATVESMAADAVGEYKKTEESPAPVVDVDEAATIIEHNYNVEYTSPSGAVSYKNFPSAFSSNGTYKLLDDVTISVRISPTVFTSNVVIDMNGKNLTSSAPDEVFLLGRNGSASAHKTWSVINTSSTPSVIEATEADCDGVVITGSFNDFTLGENVTLKTKDVAAWIGDTKANNSITIDGDVETSDCYALYVHGTNPGPNTVTVNGSVKGDAVGIYGAGNADYIINGSVEGDTGIYIKSGALSVNDGATVKGTGTKANYTYNSSGVNATGDAIVIDNCGYPGGAPDANISGGTILSDNATAVASYVKQDDQTQTGSFDRIDDVVPADSTAKFSDEIDTDLIPDGKKLVENTDGTYSIADIPAENGANLALEGTIEENIYIDADAYQLGNDAVIKVNYNASTNISETPDPTEETYLVKNLTPYDDPKDDFDGTYKFSFKQAPAQITEDVVVALYKNADATTPVTSITYSVKDYCDNVIETSNNAKLVALCKSILDYGAAAQLQFDYNTDNMAVDTFYNAAAIEALTYSDITGTYLSDEIGIKGCAFQCLANTNINLYFDEPLTSKNIIALVDGDDESTIKANYMISETDGLFVSVNSIEAGNMTKNFTIITSNGAVTTNLNTIVKTCLYYGTASTLAKTIYFYADAANTYFN